MKPNIATKTLLLILVSLVFFHVSVLLKIIPEDIVWGGSSEAKDNTYLLESISLLATFYLIFVLLIKGSFIKQLLPHKVVKVSLWVFLILFLLNTLGNLLAQSATEKFFALITMTIVVLLGIILRSKED